MAENKKSVLLYCDLIHTIEKMTDEQSGKFFKHYLRYINDQNPQTDDIMIELVFESVKQNLKRDLIKWEGERNKRSEAGKKGMASRWGNKNKSVITKDNSVMDGITNITDNVNVNVTDNVNVTVKENKLTIKEEDKDFLVFKEFQKSYKGTKRGVATEFNDFKKNKDWKEVLPTLSENLKKQEMSRWVKEKAKEFVPSWKHLRTWVNQRCWEEETDINPDLVQIEINGKIEMLDKSKFSERELNEMGIY